MREADFGPGAPGRLVATEKGIKAYLPNPLPPDIPPDFELMKAHGRAMAAIGGLESAFPPENFDPFILAYPLIQREAICSSRMEGTFTTPRDMALFDMEAEENEVAASQTREVLNYVDAVRKGVEIIRKKNRPICHFVIQEAHKVLMDGVRGQDKRPGCYRKTANYIGRRLDGLEKARFVPPPGSEVQGAMDSLERFINLQMTPDAQLPILVSLAMAHYQFETIHPFEDGNGRIGRLLMPLILIERGLLKEPLLHMSPALEKRKEEYVDLMLRVSQQGSWKEWILFFLDVVQESANEALGKARALRKLRVEYDEKVITRRVSALLPKLLDELFKRPSITISRAVEILKVTQPQAAAHIHRLEALGILEEVTGRTKNKRYGAMEIYDIIFD